MKRREALLGGLGLGLAMAGSLPARAADDYPNRPIRVIVPYAAGGGNSLAARLALDAMQPLLGQQIIIENRPGATGMVGIDYVVKAAPDGYTLLWTSSDMPTLAAIKPNLPYDLAKNITYIGKVAENGLVVTVASSLPVHSMTELVAYGRAHPGKLLYGTSGIGSMPHMAGLLFDKETGIVMTPVPYKGVAESITDMMGDRIQVLLLTPVSVAGFIGSDKMRFLGIMAPERSALFPDTKTMEDLSMPAVTDKATVWYGMFGPAGLPQGVVTRFGKAIATIAKDKDVQAKFLKNGLQMSPVLGNDFRQSTLDEYARWKDIADTYHIRATD